MFASAGSIGRKPHPNLMQVIRKLGLTTNLRVCLDAGDRLSFEGGGDTWRDLSGNGNDFYRGSGTGSDSADPTHNGVAGRRTKDEYFSYDGGDYFTLAQSNPAWVNSFHKAGAKFTICQWNYLNAIGNTLDNAGGIGDLQAAGGGVGCELILSVSTLLAVEFGVGGGGTTTSFDLSSTATLNNNAWNFTGLSIDIAAGIVIFQLNDTTETHTGQSYSSPSSSAAGATLQLGALGAGQTPDKAGCRIMSAAMWDGALSGSNLLALYSATKVRLGL